MSDSKAELARSWLIKSHRDLLSAHELATATVSLLDSAAYHCQQAAEKAIKGYLLFNDIRFERTHDIVLLVNQASDVDVSFLSHLENARLLTPLAVEFRYPGEFLEPDLDEFQDAYKAAREIYDFVIGKLPEEVTV
jgi:HEPN domain-containing protein